MLSLNAVSICLILFVIIYLNLTAMKKISEEDFSKMALMGRGKSSPFYRAILGLHIGEALFISTEEWNGCQTPTRICRYIEKRFQGVKYICGRLTDGSGWAVKREK